MSTTTTTTKGSKRQIIQSDIWFSDGNIVLQVEEDNICIQFRVHKSVLARSSEFFRDLFAIPQPENPSDLNETIDGIPIVSFTGDSIKDWTTILSAMHDPFFFKAIKADHIIAMFRIGKKYLFPKFLTEAQNILVAEYPATLPQYRQIASQSTIPKIKADLTVKFIGFLDEGILPLCILPALYYETLGLHLKSIIFNSGDAKYMSPNTRALLLAGHERIAFYQAEHTFAWLRPPYCNRSCKLADSENRIRTIHNASTTCPLWTGITNLRPFMTFDELRLASGCLDCHNSIRTCLQTGADSVWDLLPSCFDLPSWKRLTIRK